MQDIIKNINHPIEKIFKTQKTYWKNVLYRVADVLLLLCSQGFPLKAVNYLIDGNVGNGNDDEDNYGTLQNGNFIRYLKLISKHDDFLDNHMKEFSNKNEGSTSCFSLTTFKEFIMLMEQKVYNAVIEEIKIAKYYSIIIDATPSSVLNGDIEPSFIFRYVQKDGKEVERFLCFLNNTDNGTEDLANEVFDILKANNLDIKDCRGLGYDPASDMSGKYLALQSRVKESCTYANYMPYSVYTLNFVAESSAKCHYIAYKCYTLIDELLKFFWVSTYHWQVLMECSTENVSNKISDKNWSNHDETWYGLSENWTEIIKALYKIFNNEIENVQSSYEAGKLLNQLESLEICIIVSVWSDVLEQINQTGKKLQEISIDLISIISMHSSLIQYISDLRDKFDYYETKCIEKSGINEYITEDWNNLGRKKISHDGELLHNLKEMFKTQVFIPILDSLITELKKRELAYVEMNNTFGFFFHLAKMMPSEVEDKAKSFQNCFPNDLSIEYFPKECVELHRLLLNLSTDFPKTILELYQMLQEIGKQNIFPEVNIALRMFLCGPAFYSSKEFNNGHVVFNQIIRDHDFHDYGSHDNDDDAHDNDGPRDNDDNDNDGPRDNDDNDNYGIRMSLLEKIKLLGFNDGDDVNYGNEMKVLERIKTNQLSRNVNYFRDGQDYKPILTIESDLTKSLKYDDIIEQFSQSLLERYGY